MKKILLSTAATICFLFSALAQVKMPSLSPTQTIKQEFGIGSIELTYSRPSTKDRKIFGALVPYNKIWRTGANAATSITFTEPVEIAGKKIDTGTYALYSIPDEFTWEIILNKGVDNWGTDGYDQSKDVIRFKVATYKLKNQIETFSMAFTDVTATTCQLEIKWEKTAVYILITANFKEKLKRQIDAAMQTDKKAYWQAAQFYNEFDKNLPIALENVIKAIEENDKAYWMWLYKAKIQKDMNDKAGAMQSSKKSLELAIAEKNDDYIKMNKDLQKSLK
jgi:flagellar hook-basal body complex protein FliE